MVMDGSHVLMVVENCAVPDDRRVWNQARALVNHGYRVTVISPVNKNRGLTDRRETLDGVDIVRFPMPFGGPRKRDFILEYGWAVLVIYLLAVRVWLRRPFQFIHVANPPDLFFGLKWMFGWRGVSFIFDQHDLGPETYQSKFDESRVDLVAKLLAFVERRSYRAADVAIVTNESYRERAVGRGRMPDDRVFTVRNSPDPELFAPREPRQELKGRFKFMAVFVGTMGHQDGVHVVLDAADHIRSVRGRDDILFVVMGTGDAFKQVLAQHERLGLGDSVQLPGFVPDDEMLDYLATADVGLAPDLDSPLNNISTMIKTMDYMCMGLPVVSFDLVESRRSAADAAVYVAESSPAAFGDAIVDLLDDEEGRQIMAEKGRQRITNELSWEKSARNLMDAYAAASKPG